MTTMIEKMARATMAALDEWGSFAVIDKERGISSCRIDDSGIDMRVIMRAALNVMLEPSKAMVDAGIEAAEEVEDYTRDTDGTDRIDTPSDMPEPVFLAMIQAALDEESLAGSL